MNLPQPIADALAPLFEQHPIETMMDKLVVTEKPKPEFVALVDACLRTEALAGRKDLAAGLWLYIDDLDRSHAHSQEMKDATGSFWHGIMHRREGDFSNSHYWFARTGDHPAMKNIKGYEPDQFVDDASEEYTHPSTRLIQLQRAEWQALFEWCAKR